MGRPTSKTKKTKLHAEIYQFTAVFDPDPEGGYTVTVPVLPGLVTEGDTFEEAKAMAEEAIFGYLESMRKHGETIPVEDSSVITTRVAVTVPR